MPSPGGKTAQMLNEGAIVKAIDISIQRVEKLKNNINRVGLCKNFQAEVLDIMSINLKAKFDVVLLDALVQEQALLGKTQMCYG